MEGVDPRFGAMVRNPTCCLCPQNIAHAQTTTMSLSGSACPKTYTFDKRSKRCKKAARFSASCPEGKERDQETGYCRNVAKTQRRRPRTGPVLSMAEMSAVVGQLRTYVNELLRTNATVTQAMQTFNGDLADHDHRIARIDEQVRGIIMAAGTTPLADTAAAASLSPNTRNLQQLLSLSPIGDDSTRSTATSALSSSSSRSSNEDNNALTRSEIDRQLEGVSDPGSAFDIRSM